MSDTTNGTSGTTEQVKQAAGQVMDQATDKAAQFVDQAKEQARPALQNQKERAVAGLDTTAQALRKTGQHLREQDQGTVAQYMDQVAGRVEQFGGYLRRRDLNTLVADTEQFARRQPGLFLSGAFVLGLLGARFLKSSSQRAQAAARQDGTGSQGQWPERYGRVSTPSGFGQARDGNWQSGRASGVRESSQAESAWTSRDERASAGMADAGGTASPAGLPASNSPTSGEAAR